MGDVPKGPRGKDLVPRMGLVGGGFPPSFRGVVCPQGEERALGPSSSPLPAGHEVSMLLHCTPLVIAISDPHPRPKSHAFDQDGLSQNKPLLLNNLPQKFCNCDRELINIKYYMIPFM